MGLREILFFYGVLPILSGSMLSGLATTLSQHAYQKYPRDSYVYTIELSVYSLLFLPLLMMFSADLNAINEDGLFVGWNAFTIIPAITNAIGGIVVGEVIRHAGGVRKGFGVILGMLITCILQYMIDGVPLTLKMWIALPLVLGGIYVHTVYPYPDPDKEKKELLMRTVSKKSVCEFTHTEYCVQKLVFFILCQNKIFSLVWRRERK